MGPFGVVSEVGDLWLDRFDDVFSVKYPLRWCIWQSIHRAYVLEPARCATADLGATEDRHFCDALVYVHAFLFAQDCHCLLSYAWRHINP